MLEDRDYMRQPAYDDGPSFSRLLRMSNWSWTIAILVVNVAIFLLECALSPQPLALHPDNLSNYYPYVALSLDGIKHGYLWQLLTYQFMHASFLHIFFNCWAIFVFGRILEPMLGARNFLIVYFSSGVLGGICQVLASLFLPQLFGDGTATVVGASAGAFGLVAAFAALFPDRELTMLLFFVIPVTMRAKTLLIISMVLALGGMALPGLFDRLLGGNVANAAHLGGMIFGLVYVREIILGKWFRGGASGSGKTGPIQPRNPDGAAPKSPLFWRSKPRDAEEELSTDELLKTQVDPILDKISAHGLHSLTAREREILEKASGKVAKR